MRKNQLQINKDLQRSLFNRNHKNINVVVIKEKNGNTYLIGAFVQPGG